MVADMARDLVGAERCSIWLPVRRAASCIRVLPMVFEKFVFRSAGSGREML